MVADGTTRYPRRPAGLVPELARLPRVRPRPGRAVAERYGQHPAVALWHVSNELGCHNALCYCDVSAARSASWLQKRYGTIDALNGAWGTAFWSQRYGDWGEIGTPRLTLSTRNPSQVLDFHRFSSDELLDYYRAEARASSAATARRRSPPTSWSPRTSATWTTGRGRPTSTSSPTTTTSTTGSATRVPNCPSPPTSPAASPAASRGCSWSTPPDR